jgi:4-carboxymuconolactone decarboxylase
MARLPALKREDLDADSQAVWDRVVGSRGSVRGPMALLMHNPPLADRVAELGARLRFQGTLSGADRELAILTAGREVEATYEWAAHEPLGLDEGISREAIEVLRHQASTTALQEREALIIDVVRTIQREHHLPEDLYAKAEHTFGQSGLVEIVVLAGYYGLIGYVLNVFEADLPEGITPAFDRQF